MLSFSVTCPVSSPAGKEVPGFERKVLTVVTSVLMGKVRRVSTYESSGLKFPRLKRDLLPAERLKPGVSPLKSSVAFTV